MKFEIGAKCILEMEHTEGDKQPHLKAVKINLILPDAFDEDMYMKDGLPNADGAKALSNILVQGLIANIHNAHQRGFHNDAEHIRFVISELERGFIEIVKTGESTF